jgi:hypothetical protein
MSDSVEGDLLAMDGVEIGITLRRAVYDQLGCIAGDRESACAAAVQVKG